MAQPVSTLASPVELITETLADLGHLFRRVQAGSLDQTDFYDLVNRMRRNLKSARLQLNEEAEPMTLGDLRMAAAAYRHAALLTPALRDGGPDRVRTYGRLAVIDGGRPFDTPITGD